jgi:hypothetical protein
LEDVLPSSADDALDPPTITVLGLLIPVELPDLLCPLPSLVNCGVCGADTFLDGGLGGRAEVKDERLLLVRPGEFSAVLRNDLGLLVVAEVLPTLLSVLEFFRRTGEDFGTLISPGSEGDLGRGS